MEEKNWVIMFNCLSDFTFERYRKTIRHFLSLERGFKASLRGLLEAGWTEKSASAFIERRKKFSWDQYQNLLRAEGLKTSFISEENYPFFLKNIYSPPPLFYYRGSLDLDWKKSLSVVGARNFSFYSQKIMEDFLPPLIRRKINIVSGLALGVDSLAHQICLDNQGKTTAVLGSGLDWASIYPYRNRKLAQKIVEHQGLIISEFPPRTKPLAFNFPRRNRIIAGLTMITWVVEATKKSGSLITARQAIDEGRDLASLPANIDQKKYEGNNLLIKCGADPVLSSVDLLEHFGFFEKRGEENFSKNYQAKNNLEAEIIKSLENGPKSVDELFYSLKNSKIDISKINATLLLLEIKGVIRNLGAKNYELI